jgi:hypothetical protein
MKTFIYGIIVLLILRLFSPAYSADNCPQNVQKLQTGTVTNCTGWLVSEPKMQEIMKDAEQLELQKKLQLQQEHLRKLDLQEIEFYKLQNSRNMKALEKSESQKYWTGIGAFALGVIVTGLAAKVAIESTR